MPSDFSRRVAAVASGCLCVVTTLSLASPPPQPSGAHAVLRDCLDHGQITRAFSLRALRAARRDLGPDVARYTFCPGAIRSAISGHVGPPGPQRVQAILRDCVAHRGALIHRYMAIDLRRAKRDVPGDVAAYTHCAQGITSQLTNLTLGA